MRLMLTLRTSMSDRKLLSKETWIYIELYSSVVASHSFTCGSAVEMTRQGVCARRGGQ